MLVLARLCMLLLFVAPASVLGAGGDLCYDDSDCPNGYCDNVAGYVGNCVVDEEEIECDECAACPDGYSGCVNDCTNTDTCTCDESCTDVAGEGYSLNESDVSASCSTASGEGTKYGITYTEKTCVGNATSGGCASAGATCSGCSDWDTSTWTEWGDCEIECLYSASCPDGCTGYINECTGEDNCVCCDTCADCDEGYSGCVNECTGTDTCTCDESCTDVAGEGEDWYTETGTCTLANGTCSRERECVDYCVGNAIGGGCASAGDSCYGCDEWETECDAWVYDRTCNTGYILSGTTCVAKSYTCSAGYYLNGTTCTKCTAGYYCAGGTWTYNGGIQGRSSCGGSLTSAAGASAIGSCYITCAAGKYLAASATSCSTCTAGSYCVGGTYYYKSSVQGITACGGGKYSAAGASSCSSISAGCYGTSASSACPASCSGRTKYSAAGASACSTVSTGYYTTGCNTSGNACTGQSQCSAGNYCSSGVSYACGAGKYSSAGASSCSSISAGCYGTSATSACPASCAKGYYSTGGASACTACPAGTYGSTTGLTSAACSGKCAAGYYGSETAQTASTCSGSCTANYYCPAGSTSATQNGCPSGYPYSAAGAGAITSCYSATKPRAWSGSQTACSKPSNCASVTCNSCSIAACDYVAYSNSAGTGDGTIKSGCSSNSAACQQTVKSVTANANYYVDGTTCPACGTSYPYSDGGSISSSYCYTIKTSSGSQVACSKPANSASYTCGTCTVGTCNWRDYNGATDTSCTPDNCTQPVSSVTCNTGYYKSGVTCPACTNKPANSSYTGTATSDSCPWSCNSGYNQTSDNQCGQFCGAGITHLHLGNGVSIPLYSSARTSPAINVKWNNTVCYGSLESGTGSGLHVKYDGTVYHAVN
ncbi:MAG: hypothetical protein J6L47_04300 [Alphaproteobacteria bacterium]|nr:hypothetical protein [Alphaproteobacteria bacterium]